MLNTFLSTKMKPTYLCVLYVGIVGVKHPIFDTLYTHEIALLVYVIIDVRENKVVGMQRYMVNPQIPEVREQLLTLQFIQQSPFKEMFSNRFESLGSALKQFHQYVESTFNIDLSTHSLCFVTDGQVPLRQHMYPLASSKNIELPQYYTVFYDLIKEFRNCYKSPNTINSIPEIARFLEIQHNDSEYCVKKIGDMVKITQMLISEHHKFENPDTINIVLVPRIYRSFEQVGGDCVVRIMGIPRDCSEQDVAKFFIGLNLAEGGVALCLNYKGRRNGRALVRFVNQEHRDLALTRNKQRLANNHVDVSRASGEHFIKVAGVNNDAANEFISRGAEVIMRMTNLPFSCTAEDVLTFFAEGENSCKVMLGEEGVFFVKNSVGAATGIALVLFARAEDAGKALRKRKIKFGTQFIQLFQVTFAEVQQVLNYAAKLAATQ